MDLGSFVRSHGSPPETASQEARTAPADLSHPWLGLCNVGMT